MHVALPKRTINRFQPVLQSRQKEKRAYCPNIYTVLLGHLKIADYIARNVNEKNPSTNTGWTPLHFLAERGYNDTFRYIHDYCEDKNPVTGDSGETVLHKAAEAEGKSFKWIFNQSVQETQ